MNREFVFYEQALILRELGFNESCFAYYTCERDLVFMHSKTKFLSCEFAAPTFFQAFRWFRLKYGYNCFIPSTSTGKYYYFRENLNDRREDSEPELTPKFDSYEEAELACLKKLIEMVQITESKQAHFTEK
jgi:hypothetical protein